MRRSFILVFIASLVLGAAVPTAVGAAVSEEQQKSRWFQDGQAAMAEAGALQPNRAGARNVILFVGDGMGVSTVSAARILEGQLAGGDGEGNSLSFEELPYLALSKTYSTNQQVADSAPTVTAMTTGVKTGDGMINVDSDTIRGDCASQQGNELSSFFMLAETAGRSTGVVSTARITHATPAGAYAQVAERDWESTAPDGCQDIATQLVDWAYGDGLEVALGGGRSNFLPTSAPDPEDAGQFGARVDGRNLVDEWTSRPGSVFVWNQAQFDAVDLSQTDHLLGLFEGSHMEYSSNRSLDTGGEPSLAEMTAKAIELLSQNRRGYTLMVEAGRIDHGHHEGNAYRALTDTIALSEAVATAISMVNLSNTLIVVTADHSHTLTISGYPEKGNPILGIAGTGSDGHPYTTLGYANGPGSATSRVGLTGEMAADPNFHQPALVPLGSETHGGEDVAIYATGPRSHLFHGTVEQNYIGVVIMDALGLAP